MNVFDSSSLASSELSLKSGINADFNLYEIRRNGTGRTKSTKTHLFEDKIEARMNYSLGSLFQQVLVKEFQKSDKPSFQEFYHQLLANNWKDVFDKYPLSKQIYLRQEKNITGLISFIIDSFYRDKAELQYNSFCNSNDLIEDINWGKGDLHNGLSTTMITLSGGKKLIFKPTDGRIVKAYNHFFDWVNSKYFLGRYKYKSINQYNYHWQEFIDDKPCESKEELSEFYYRAGWVLCLVYLLNGRDFHRDNLISNGSNPILIDHELIVSPKLASRFRVKPFDAKIEDTIFDSSLLPNQELHKYFLKGVSGFGVQRANQAEVHNKQAVNRLAKDWNALFGDVQEAKITHNVPVFEGEKVYLREYINCLVEGFETCYSFLIKERECLLSDDSPLRVFADLPARYVWRSTSVYSKIMNYMRLPQNLIDAKTFEEKITKYLSIAYEKIEDKQQVQCLLKSEVKQMIDGNIPYFQVNTSSRHLETDFGVIENFFEINCMENLARKVKKLSLEDLEIQKKLIRGTIN